MKKMIAFALAAVMVLALVACGGDKGPARDDKGYLTEDAAKTFAAQSVGYSLKDVNFTESSFEGDAAGGDENAFFSFSFTDSVAVYTCKVNATDGTVYDSSAK